jgi:hypothetical protein
MAKDGRQNILTKHITKHIYFCQEEKIENPCFEEDYEGFAVVATSTKEAIEISGMKYAEDLLRDEDASELPIGRIDPLEGLRRQIYGRSEGKCPSCSNPKQYAKLFWDEDLNKIYCEECGG